MKPLLHIVVSCTDRKRLSVDPRRRLRTVEGGPLRSRAEAWARRLQDPDAERSPARSVYAGDHWYVARELPEIAAAAGFEPTLWVASAGYGLLHAETPIAGYSATFTGGHADSVAKEPLYRRLWWEALSQSSALRNGHPRTLEELVSRDPSAALLVVGSFEYVDALRNDLWAARETLAEPDRLAVVTRADVDLPELNDHLVPSDARLQPLVKGALGALHVRVARKVLSELDRPEISATELRRRQERLLASLPAPERPQREALSDDQVRRWILDQFANDPRASKTGLLRQLRGEGWACEQKRFGALFEQCREVTHAA